MIETQEKFLVFGKPDITYAEEQAVLNVLRSGWLGNGVVSKELETEFEKLHPGRYAVAVNSCTMGLILALKAEGIGRYDEVITTPLTFAATVNAILAVGARPVLVDVDETGCIDPKLIKRQITPLTKAIIPVHLHGYPCQMDEILTVAQEHGLKVVEDAAHAFGGSFGGIPLGSLGHYGVFSFYPTKNLASADGGLVLVNDQVKADYLRQLASQGLSSDAWMRYGSGRIKNYAVESEGLKGSMNDLCAAIALSQLKRWPELKEKRQAIWSVYERYFGKKAAGHSQHIYSIRVKNRDKYREKLYEAGIGTGVHYKSLNTEPGFKWLSYSSVSRNAYPMAETFGEETLSLPLSSTMSVQDAERVVESVNKIGEGI